MLQTKLHQNLGSGIWVWLFFKSSPGDSKVESRLKTTALRGLIKCYKTISLDIEIEENYIQRCQKFSKGYVGKREGKIQTQVF